MTQYEKFHKELFSRIEKKNSFHEYFKQNMVNMLKRHGELMKELNN